MSDVYQPTSAPEPVAPPPAPSAEPAPPPPDVSNFDSQDYGRSYEGEGFRDGRPTQHASAYSAAKELARRRNERSQAPNEFLESYVEDIQYRDGRPRDQEVDARQAAKDLGEYRRTRNEQLKTVLDEIEGRPQAAQDAAGQEAQAQPQPAPATPYEAAQAELAAERETLLIPQLRSRLEELDASIREATAQRAGLAAHARTHGVEFPASPEEVFASQAHATLKQLDGVLQQQQDVLLAHALGSNQAALEYSNIRTPEDLAKLPPEGQQRYTQWAQHRVAVANELNRIEAQRKGIANAAQAELQQQQAAQFKQYAELQDSLVGRMIPECSPGADPEVQQAFQGNALRTLRAADFKDEELAAAWNGAPFSLRDARVQKVIADATRWRLSQERAAVAIKKPVPPVQRPGVVQDRGLRAEFVQQQLSQRLDNARSDQEGLRIGAQLLRERRAAARR